MSGDTLAARVAMPSAGRAPAVALAVADWRRIRRTWIVPLTVLGPLGVTAMGVILFLMKGEWVLAPYHRGAQTAWAAMVNQLGMVQVFSLGLGATLLASMIADVEHRSDGWKQMFSLPVSRPAAFAVKFAWVAALLAVSSALMALGYAALMIWQALLPLPWDRLAAAAALPWVAALPLLAFQLLVSVSIRNQAPALTLGVLAPMLGMGMSQMPAWMPWRLITQAMTWCAGGVIAGGPGEPLAWLDPGAIVAVSVAWVVILVGVGATLLARREIR